MRCPWWLVLVAACGHAGHARGPAPLGGLEFPVSGSPACQASFHDGMLMLHSFLYDQAHQEFAAAFEADPSCAMAAWGDAMTFDHPIWVERSPEDARAALARVTDEASLPEKERAYLKAARALFAEDDADPAHRAWLVEASAMHTAYPDDDEVQLQYVLALLSVYGYDPAHVREQMEAGSIALQVFARRPDHPGAAHYIIHAFDSPEHAILALPAALTYARIAPAAGHAQHMPSHTFAHLGMWREVVPSNERATAADPADWHSYSWLVAAHMELGHYAKARELVEHARALITADHGDDGDFRYDYGNMVASYLTQTRRWDELDALVAPLLEPALDEDDDTVACAMHMPGGGHVRLPKALLARLTADVLRAEAALATGHADEVAAIVAELQDVRAQMAPWSPLFWASDIAPWDARVAALLARAQGGDAAIAAIEAQVTADAASQSVGPSWTETSLETLGDALLAAGKPAEAQAAYERDLASHPNRAIALLGAVRAAKAAGDDAQARAHLAALTALWADADADVAAQLTTI